MRRRRIVTGEEQDLYTSWRRVLFWQRGERKKIKRRTHKRERHEGRQESQAVDD